MPWGTLDGTVPHSEKQSLDGFTRWRLSMRKSQTHGQFREECANPKFWQLECHDLPGRRPFCNPCKHTTCTAELVPSVACAYVCIIEMRACRVEELGIAPNWLGSIDSKTAAPIYLLTTKSSANLDRAGVTEIGRICLAMVVTGFTFIRGVTSASFKDLESFCSTNDAFRMSQRRSQHSPNEANC